MNLYMKDIVWLLLYSSCKSCMFLTAEVSNESLFWLIFSISEDIVDWNLSFVFFILASNENKNRWVWKCIPFLGLILIYHFWSIIFDLSFDLSLQWLLTELFKYQKFEGQYKTKTLFEILISILRFYSYLMSCSFASQFSD